MRKKETTTYAFKLVNTVITYLFGKARNYNVEIMAQFLSGRAYLWPKKCTLRQDIFFHSIAIFDFCWN